MRVVLPYGETGLELELPGDAEVIEPRPVPGVTDEPGTILQALRSASPSLLELLRPGDDVCVVVPDITRPAPTRQVVSCLRELASQVSGSRLWFLIGTGLHRPCTPAEIETILGPGVPGVNHNARDQDSLSLVDHTSAGIPVWLNRRYLEADRRVSVSLLEPHFFAGFSGGPKAIVPGVAGRETILGIHSARLIGDPSTTWAKLDGNPVQAAIREACGMAPPDFSINVSINREREITGVFAGEVGEAHRRGCAFLHDLAMVPVARPADIVVTTNGGWPLDQNLYQTVKGLSAAARITEPGGCIVAAAECRYGFPPGNFEDLLRAARTPAELIRQLRSLPDTVEDQWEAQVLGQILERATVFLLSRLEPAAARAAFLHPVGSIQQGLDRARELRGNTARVAVLPQGPFTVPYLQA